MHQVYEPVCRGLHASPPALRAPAKPAATTFTDFSRMVAARAHSREIDAHRLALAERLGEIIANALAIGVVGAAVAWIVAVLVK